MATPPDFSVGQVLTAAQMNAVGLWLIKEQTVGTAVSSVTVTDAFSANYDAYLIVYTDCQKSADNAIRMRLGAKTGGYYGNHIYGHYNDTTVRSGNDNNAAYFGAVGGGDQFTGGGAVITVINPFLSRQTYVFAPVSYSLTNGNYSGRTADTTSYTSFELSATSGTMTGGIIRVYGYRN
jgi:hypothetical protein